MKQLINSIDTYLTKFRVCSGTGKASSVRETSNLVIETVEKKPGAKVKHRFVGDASKVVAKGNGLKKAFAGRAANFSVEVKGAGTVHNRTRYMTNRRSAAVRSCTSFCR